MATLEKSLSVPWLLTDEENDEARKLSDLLRKKLERIVFELREGISEFQVYKIEDVLNTPDIWKLQGRLSLAIQLLQDDDQARNVVSEAVETPQL